MRTLKSHAVRDTYEAGHMTTHASHSEVANMLCWCHVDAGSPRPQSTKLVFNWHRDYWDIGDICVVMKSVMGERGALERWPPQVTSSDSGPAQNSDGLSVLPWDPPVRTDNNSVFEEGLSHILQPQCFCCPERFG